jgi:hypothetical protein
MLALMLVLIAQGSRELPLAARSAAMGQASIAADPDEGAAFSNPASLALRTGPWFGASAGGATSFGTPVALPDADPTHLDTAVSLPTAVSTGLRLGGEGDTLALALSLLVPMEERGRVDSSSNTSANGLDTSRQFTRDFTLERILIGPSAAIALSDLDLRLGMSLFLELSELSDRQFTSALGTSESMGLLLSLWNEDESSRRATSLIAVFGAQWDLDESLCFGASVKLGAPISGSGDVHQVVREMMAGPAASSVFEGNLTGVAVPDPTELRFGARWFLFDRDLELRADLIYVFDLGNPRIGRVDATADILAGNEPPQSMVLRLDERLSTRDAIDVSVGGSVRLFDELSVSAGFLSDRSISGNDIPDQTSGGVTTHYVRLPRRDRYLGTAGARWWDGVVELSLALALGLERTHLADLVLTNDPSAVSSGLVGRLVFSARWGGGDSR